jgi:membrane protein required for colicin V production
MTWVDGAALAVVLLSAVFSMVRGFVREVLGVIAWVGAAFAAVKYYTLVLPEVQSVLGSVLPGKNFVVYVAMAVVFIVVLVVLSLISALIGGLVRDSALSGLDRSLGLVFGAVRGIFVVCLAYIALSVGVDQAQWPAAVDNARFLPLAHSGATAIVAYLPKSFQPKVDAIQGAPAPTAGALMQQPVAGSALSTQ